MDCDRIWDWMSLYADGEADDAQRRAVDSHLATCKECAQDMVFLQDASRVLRATPSVEPPHGLREAILLATIDRPSMIERFRESIQRGLRLAPMRYSLVAASGAAAALAFFALTNNPSGVVTPGMSANGSPIRSGMNVASNPSNSESMQNGISSNTEGSTVYGPANQFGPFQPEAETLVPKPSMNREAITQPIMQAASFKAPVSPNIKKTTGPIIQPIPVFQPEVRSKVPTMMAEEITPVEPEPLEMSKVEPKPMNETNPMKDPGMKPVVKQSYTIMLASNTAVVPTRLTDIGKMGERKNDLTGRFPLPDSLREKNIRLDVVKGSF